MSKIAHYLQEHLAGEVMTNMEVRRHFATDSSIFSITPSVIVYPRSESDIRKTARFTWQLAERGRRVPITSRGLGTDQSGGAIGTGIVMVFPAHMNRIIEFDGKAGVVTVEPGINYGKLQQTLHTYGRFLPPYPASIEYSTLGGAIANNASGEKSVKYGDTAKFVRSMRVVLANGEVIETGRLSKREVNKKLGLSTFEGEVYRAIDTLLEEQHEIIDKVRPPVSKNTAGYNLWDVRHKDGSLDLTPLFIGSQGTLGIITEATLETEAYNPETTVIAAFVDTTEVAEQILADIRSFPSQPSAIEIVNDKLLNFIDEQNPNLLQGVVSKPFPKLVMLIEFDDLNGRQQKKLVKKTEKLLSKVEVTFRTETEDQLKDQLWKIRHSVSWLLTHSEGQAKPVPIIEDGIVPVEQFGEFIKRMEELFEKHKLPGVMWGHAGEAHLHTRPLLDLSQVGDRQKVFKLMDEYYTLVMGLGGSMSGSHNDGRLRAPYLSRLYGEPVYELFVRVKQIFDPHSILNPGVKVNVGLDDIKPLLRQEYSLKHLFDYLPRT